MGRIIVISNRVTQPGMAIQAGGMAVALEDVVKRLNGVWVGWDGQVIEDDVGERKLRGRRVGSIATTSLTKREHEGFYLGYSNTVLWPVFHNRLDLAKFEAGYFQTYSDVNARFARLILPFIKPDDTIWVHDYQFILIGLELRKLGVTNPIGFFLHIPVPPSQSFLAIPEHRELARAFSAYQLIGLQTRADVANLLDYFEHGVGGRLLNDGRIRVYESVVSVESFPIGIDPGDFVRRKSNAADVQSPSQPLRLIGVDRLDYSKGLPHKFRAFGRLLELYPEYKKKVVLTQIAPPTRQSVDAYTVIRDELQELSGAINGRFGDLDWVPIHYIHRSIPRSRLAEIYRSSRVGLVTPLRDGMNLVAKEYIAAQDPMDPGVLILSQFAGAAEEMKDALIVNPYNIDQTAEAVRTAIAMPLKERRARFTQLFSEIKSNNVFDWADNYLNALHRCAEKPQLRYNSDHAIRVHAALKALERSSFPTAPAMLRKPAAN